MGYTRADAASDAHDAELADAALNEAYELAGKIAARFTEAHEADAMSARASVDLAIGSRDQPLFVFTIGLAVPLGTSIDTNSFRDLLSDLNAAISDSALSWWDWTVTASRVEM